MGRVLRFHENTWLDRKAKKFLKGLSSKEREFWKRQLTELAKTLVECSHPATGPEVSKFRPSAYRGVVSIAGGSLYEYRLPRLTRVIAAFFPTATSGAEEDTILMVGVTFDHDHDRLKTLVKNNSDTLHP